MTGRRSHRKSRSGCGQCKARKIKCDETKPSCNNCLKHGVLCSFTHPRAAPPFATEGPPSIPVGMHVMCQCRLQQKTTWMMELELLHHYTTSTCYTISRHPVVQTIFRINVPQLGFTSQFVMHALLAISALHIARFKPEHEAAYFSRAMLFHETAMRDVVRILPHVTQDNCAALYVFSVLTCVIPCAKPRRGRDFLLMGDGGISEWLIAFRGTRSIVESASEMLLNSPIAAIFSDGVRKTQRREACTAKKHPYLLNLYQLFDEAATSQEILETYKSAVDELCKSFEAVFEPAMQGFESSDVFFWLFRVSEDYLTLLASREPLALIIFAHFCVLLKQLEWTWWMEGWSNHLLFGIYNSVCSEYRPWLQWPIEQIGWVPQDVRGPQNSLMMDAAR